MKTGLFFGSFNPIHIGHLMLANYMISYTDLDEVWFVVSPHNPLKEKKSLLDGRQRLYMVNLAIEDRRDMRCSDIEFSLSQPSYTINTLVHLNEKYPDKEFALIMGADNLESFPKWKNYEEILKKYFIYVYPRIVSSPSDLINDNRVLFTQAPIIEISSTFIRNSIKNKKDIAFFLHPKVWEYIREMHFYEK